MSERQAKAARRGEGRVFRRGGTWWVSYYGPAEDGSSREYRESSGSSDERAARRLLRERLREVGNYRKDGAAFEGPNVGKLTVAHLLDSLLAEWEHGEKPLKGLRQAKGHAAPVREFFGHRRALSVTPDTVRAFITERRKGGKATATINRELAVLKRAYTLALNERRIGSKPHIPSAGPEDNVRRGFVGPAEVTAIIGHMDATLAAIVRFAFRTGWRSGEILGLTWDRIDRQAREVRLDTSKSGHGRVLPLDAELRALIEERWTARTYTRPDGTAAVSPYVFHENGRPLTDSMKAKRWKTAAKAAGLPSLVFHDLRRSAIRLLVRSGVSERVAMDVSGHKTRSVFDRYNVSASADMLEALNRQAQLIATMPESNVAEIMK
jgi:integrase